VPVRNRLSRNAQYIGVIRTETPLNNINDVYVTHTLLGLGAHSGLVACSTTCLIVVIVHGTFHGVVEFEFADETFVVSGGQSKLSVISDFVPVAIEFSVKGIGPIKALLTLKKLIDKGV